MKGRDTGGALLEILVAIPLGGVLAAMLWLSLHHALLLTAKARKIDQEQSALAGTRALVELLVEDLDRHRLDIPPVVHRGGRIRRADGSEHSLTRNPQIVPKPGSDAISGLRLTPLAAQTISRFAPQESASVREMLLCPRFGRTLSAENEAILVIGVDGMRIFTRRSPPLTEGACRRALWEAEADLHFAGPALASAALALPIADDYTLYLDVQGQLRRVTHRGVLNVENQPILDGISELELSLERRSGLYRVLGRVGFSGGKECLFQASSRLSRETHLAGLLAQ